MNFALKKLLSNDEYNTMLNHSKVCDLVSGVISCYAYFGIWPEHFIPRVFISNTLQTHHNDPLRSAHFVGNEAHGLNNKLNPLKKHSRFEKNTEPQHT